MVQEADGDRPAAEPFSDSSWSLLNLLLGPELAHSPLLRPFLCITLADSLATLSLFLPFLFLPDLAMAAGVPAGQAALLVSVAGLSSSLGRWRPARRSSPGSSPACSATGPGAARSPSPSSV